MEGVKIVDFMSEIDLIKTFVRCLKSLPHTSDLKITNTNTSLA